MLSMHKGKCGFDDAEKLWVGGVLTFKFATKYIKNMHELSNEIKLFNDQHFQMKTIKVLNRKINSIKLNR